MDQGGGLDGAATGQCTAGLAHRVGACNNSQNSSKLPAGNLEQLRKRLIFLIQHGTVNPPSMRQPPSMRHLPNIIVCFPYLVPNGAVAPDNAPL